MRKLPSFSTPWPPELSRPSAFVPYTMMPVVCLLARIANERRTILLPTQALVTARRFMDGVLIVLILAVAFLLGCQEMFDADVWWHVRAGQWIWEHKRLPALDPFTFASANRSWVDLHWLFQLMLAGAHQLGGVPGMVLLAAALCASVLAVGLTARDRRWPMAVTAACWLPALGAMSSRFDPRPEIISLLGVAAYLAVLFRTERTPALAWLLPLVQVIWVNSHALFVLGPIILGAYLIDHIASSTRQPLAKDVAHALPATRWWLHLGGAAPAVLLACLVNPYGWRGAIFPFELFPKITAWGGPYKTYVDEFMDLRTFVKTVGLDRAANDFYFQAECFLLILLPFSFIVPAVWQASRSSAAHRSAQPSRSLPWIVAFGFAAASIAACMPGFADAGHGDRIAQLGRFAPWGIVAIGFGGALLLLLARSSVASALLAASGGAALAAWIVWLRGHLCGPDPPRYLGAIDIVFALAATTLILRSFGRGRLFRLIVSAAFVYLALAAVRNVNLFALVAGFVMTWNFGEWALELTSRSRENAQPDRSTVIAGLIARGGLTLLATLWIAAIASGASSAPPARSGALASENCHWPMRTTRRSLPAKPGCPSGRSRSTCARPESTSSITARSASFLSTVAWKFPAVQPSRRSCASAFFSTKAKPGGTTPCAGWATR